MIQNIELALTNDLSWREAELGSLKLEISNSIKGSIKERVLLRCTWTMLYAHFEGFSVFAWKTYLETIQKEKVRLGSLPSQLIALSMEKTFRMVKSNLSSLEMLNFFTQDMQKFLNEPAMFNDPLKSESNLWPQLYRTNCQRAALPHSKADEFEVRLKLLVTRRNAIAHGDAFIVTNLDEYQPFENGVLLVLHELALAIIENINRYSTTVNPNVCAPS